MSIVIAAFPAPLPEPDQRTIADDNSTPHTLYRAVVADPPFANIEVTECDSPQSAAELVRGYRSDGAGARAGSYEVIDVGGQLAADDGSADPGQPLTFINCFEVPSGREDEALKIWREFNRYFVAKPGYLSHRLHRGDDDAAFRFVNVVQWESEATWGAAHDEGFRAMLARPLPFVSMPTLCRAVRVGAAVGARS